MSTQVEQDAKALKTLEDLDVLTPLEDGTTYTVTGTYYFYALIRDGNMIHIPDEIMEKLKAEKGDPVDIRMRKA